MEPNLLDLILFINEETTILNDPLFSRDAIAQYQEKKGKYDWKKKVNNFLAKTEIQTNEPFQLKSKRKKLNVQCVENHIALKTVKISWN